MSKDWRDLNIGRCMKLSGKKLDLKKRFKTKINSKISGLEWSELNIGLAIDKYFGLIRKNKIYHSNLKLKNLAMWIWSMVFQHYRVTKEKVTSLSKVVKKDSSFYTWGKDLTSSPAFCSTLIDCAVACKFYKREFKGYISHMKQYNMPQWKKKKKKTKNQK